MGGGITKVSKQYLSENIVEIVRLSTKLYSNIDSVNEQSDVDEYDFSEIFVTDQEPQQKMSEIQTSLFNHSKSLTSIETELSELKKFIKELSDKPTISGISPPKMEQSKPSMHVTIPESNIIAENVNFLTEDESEKLCDYLSKVNYKKENGHEVKSFGVLYRYRGAGDEISEPIPGEIQSIIDKIKELCSDSQVDINQCLINRYQNGDSSLPEHSDDELIIDPESCIYTLSVGQERSVIFRDRFSRAESTHVAKNGSLYIMTRSSQTYYNHRIDRDNSSAVRYSLTFRHVNTRFSRSTILIGDSNSKKLKFGQGKGTFGIGLPGKRVKASTVSDINPHDCAAYANVVLVVGTNDLRNKYISCKEDISKVLNCFDEKVRAIKELRKDIKLIIIPVLPTRLVDMNRHIICYNNMLYQNFIDSNTYFRIKIPGVYEFLDRQDLLRRDFVLVGDYIHLNELGLSRIAFVIKNAIFNRSGHANNKVTNNRARNTPAAERGESRPA